MSLPLDDLEVDFIGVATDIISAGRTAEFADTYGFDFVWTGDHMAFPIPEVTMLQAPVHMGGPPIWCGG